MSKSVVIIGPAYPLRGGLASYNERLAREFQSMGFDTRLHTFSLQYPSFLFPGTTQYSSEAAPHDLNIRVCINSVNPFNWWKVGRELKKNRPDLVVVRYWLPFMGPCLGTILRIVKQNRHTQVVCIADNIIPHEKRPGDKPFTTYFMKPVDGFVTMSEKVLHDLQKISHKPARLVAHPLYDNFGEPLDSAEAKQHLGIPTQFKIVLFFGFIRKYKGLDLLLDAIANLKQSGFFDKEPVRFLIAGEFYEEAAPYLQQIEQLQIADYLILRQEFIPDSEVRFYLSAADCVIQPYKSATQSGVTPLAYHFNVPMIVTKVGGLAAMVPPEVGRQAEPNAISLTEQIRAFFQDDASLYRRAIAREKKKYSWQNITDAILSLAKII